MRKPRSRLSTRVMTSGADRLFEYGVMAVGLSSLALVWMLVAKMALDAQSSLDRYGLGFLTGTDWDPNREVFGALPFIFGTLLTSGIAMLIAVPLSVGIAMYLSELAPPWIREPLSFVVELLAAVPSVIYGLWAMYALRPFISETVEPFFKSFLGWTPLFE